jgi:hypothetical protein
MIMFYTIASTSYKVVTIIDTAYSILVCLLILMIFLLVCLLILMIFLRGVFIIQSLKFGTTATTAVILLLLFQID